MRLLTVLAFLLPAALPGQQALRFDEIPSEPTALTRAQTFRGLKVPGVETRKRWRQLRKELRWYRSAASARRHAVESGRPILLVRALGTLKGFC